MWGAVLPFFLPACHSDKGDVSFLEMPSCGGQSPPKPPLLLPTHPPFLSESLGILYTKDATPRPSLTHPLFLLRPLATAYRKTCLISCAQAFS